jgi:hypothetical protein
MSSKKIALIVTDGTTAAEAQANALAVGLSAFRIVQRTGANFTATDILGAAAFFIGCAAPGPASFAGLAKLLAHINLAGRPCGLFSPGSAAAACYLSRLVAPSGAAPRTANRVDAGALAPWAAAVAAGS